MAAKTKEEAVEFLSDLVRRSLGLPQGAVRADEHLERYGIDSLQWADMAYEISLWLGRHVSPEDVASSSTIRGLATALTR